MVLIYTLSLSLRLVVTFLHFHWPSEDLRKCRLFCYSKSCRFPCDLSGFHYCRTCIRKLSLFNRRSWTRRSWECKSEDLLWGRDLGTFWTRCWGSSGRSKHHRCLGASIGARKLLGIWGSRSKQRKKLKFAQFLINLKFDFSKWLEFSNKLWILVCDTYLYSAGWKLLRETDG